MNFHVQWMNNRRSRLSCGLRRQSAAARLLGLRVRIRDCLQDTLLYRLTECGQFRDFAIDSLPDGFATAPWRIPSVWRLFPVFETVAAAKTPRSFVVSGVHGVLRGLFFLRHIDFMRRVRWRTTKPADGWNSLGITWICSRRDGEGSAFWNCLSNLRFRGQPATVAAVRMSWLAGRFLSLVRDLLWLCKAVAYITKESLWGRGCSSLVFVVCCIGSGLCDELITRTEESYRVTLNPEHEAV
jgi:hypothetical protein